MLFSGSVGFLASRLGRLWCLLWHGCVSWWDVSVFYGSLIFESVEEGIRWRRPVVVMCEHSHGVGLI